MANLTPSFRTGATRTNVALPARREPKAHPSAKSSPPALLSLSVDGARPQWQRRQVEWPSSPIIGAPVGVHGPQLVEQFLELGELFVSRFGKVGGSAHAFLEDVAHGALVLGQCRRDAQVDGVPESSGVGICLAFLRAHGAASFGALGAGRVGFALPFRDRIFERPSVGGSQGSFALVVRHGVHRGSVYLTSPLGVVTSSALRVRSSWMAMAIIPSTRSSYSAKTRGIISRTPSA